MLTPLKASELPRNTFATNHFYFASSDGKKAPASDVAQAMMQMIEQSLLPGETLVRCQNADIERYIAANTELNELVTAYFQRYETKNDFEKAALRLAFVLQHAWREEAGLTRNTLSQSYFTIDKNGKKELSRLALMPTGTTVGVPLSQGSPAYKAVCGQIAQELSVGGSGAGTALWGLANKLVIRSLLDDVFLMPKDAKGTDIICDEQAPLREQLLFGAQEKPKKDYTVISGWEMKPLCNRFGNFAVREQESVWSAPADATAKLTNRFKLTHCSTVGPIKVSALINVGLKKLDARENQRTKYWSYNNEAIESSALLETRFSARVMMAKLGFVTGSRIAAASNGLRLMHQTFTPAEAINTSILDHHGRLFKTIAKPKSNKGGDKGAKEESPFVALAASDHIKKIRWVRESWANAAGASAPAPLAINLLLDDALFSDEYALVKQAIISRVGDVLSLVNSTHEQRYPSISAAPLLTIHSIAPLSKINQQREHAAERTLQLSISLPAPSDKTLVARWENDSAYRKSKDSCKTFNSFAAILKDVSQMLKRHRDDEITDVLSVYDHYTSNKLSRFFGDTEAWEPLQNMNLGTVLPLPKGFKKSDDSSLADLLQLPLLSDKRDAQGYPLVNHEKPGIVALEKTIFEVLLKQVLWEKRTLSMAIPESAHGEYAVIKVYRPNGSRDGLRVAILMCSLSKEGLTPNGYSAKWHATPGYQQMSKEMRQREGARLLRASASQVISDNHLSHGSAIRSILHSAINAITDNYTLESDKFFLVDLAEKEVLTVNSAPAYTPDALGYPDLVYDTDAGLVSPYANRTFGEAVFASEDGKHQLLNDPANAPHLLLSTATAILIQSTGDYSRLMPRVAKVQSNIDTTGVPRFQDLSVFSVHDSKDRLPQAHARKVGQAYCITLTQGILKDSRVSAQSLMEKWLDTLLLI